MKRSILISLVFLFTVNGFANIRLPRLISDGMILQADTKVNIWGWAEPGEKVTVSVDNKTYKTSADQEGNWKIELKKHVAGGPFNMVLTGNNTLEIKNIFFGDVWFCSGQSNMELPMRRVKPLYEEEMRTASNDFIRTFTVPQKYNFKTTEADYKEGYWQELTPTSVPNFSAVAYFFATELYAKYKIPIGILNASLGGSPAEAWLSEDALKAFPNYLTEAYKWRDDKLIEETELADNKMSNQWYAESNRKDAGHQSVLWSNPDVDDSDWQTINIPGYWAETSIGNVNGVMWFRKEFNISKEDAGKGAFLNLGRIVDADSAFINGKYVGNVTYQYPPRWYNIAPQVLKEGKNVIVVRVISNAGKGGFVPDKPYELTTENSIIDLKGEWKMKLGCTMDALPGQTFVRWKPMGLYNAMIAPLENYTKKGIVWYQGESNTSNPQEYAQLLPTLIQDWRKNFNQKNLPFIYAQLPNFMEAKSEPSESNWALFREMQTTALSMPNTAMSVNIDLGEWNDIHPLNKKELASRLVLCAQKTAYKDKSVISEGAMLKKVKVKNGRVELTFSNCKDGIKSKDEKELRHFALAGKDKKFIWAKASFQGNKVILWNSEIPNPEYVRYAWADNPEGVNFYNAQHLPARPFQKMIND